MFSLYITSSTFTEFCYFFFFFGEYFTTESNQINFIIKKLEQFLNSTLICSFMLLEQ